MQRMHETGQVLGAPINVITWLDALERLLGWVHASESRYVTICNVHVGGERFGRC